MRIGKESRPVFSLEMGGGNWRSAMLLGSPVMPELRTGRSRKHGSSRRCCRKLPRPDSHDDSSSLHPGAESTVQAVQIKKNDVGMIVGLPSLMHLSRRPQASSRKSPKFFALLKGIARELDVPSFLSQPPVQWNEQDKRPQLPT